MPPHSGKFAVVGSTSTTKGWTIEESNAATAYTTSNLQCGTGRSKGVHDWTGTVTGHGGLPPYLAGESFSFVGYTAPEDDVSGNGWTASGTAVVSSVAITWDFSGASVLSYVITFGGDGALSWALGTTTDSTDVIAEAICGVEIKNDTTAFADVSQCVFTLTSDVQTYVNSSTSVAGKCWTKRKAGKIDWTVALTQECNVRDGLTNAPAQGTDVKLRLYIDGTDFWDLQWGHVMGYAGLTADTDSGALIGRTINFSMNGFNVTLGTITAPGAADPFWGTDTTP